MNNVIPPLDLRGLKVGDKVKVVDEYLNYGDTIGIVAGFEEQTMDDDFVVKVEFPTIPRAGLMPVFTEYFEPGELAVQNG